MPFTTQLGGGSGDLITRAVERRNFQCDSKLGRRWFPRHSVGASIFVVVAVPYRPRRVSTITPHSLFLVGRSILFTCIPSTVDALWVVGSLYIFSDQMGEVWVEGSLVRTNKEGLLRRTLEKPRDRNIVVHDHGT